MTNAEAIKEYFSRDGRQVTTKELLELKKGISTEEWEQLGADAIKALETKS